MSWNVNMWRLQNGLPYSGSKTKLRCLFGIVDNNVERFGYKHSSNLVGRSFDCVSFIGARKWKWTSNQWLVCVWRWPPCLISLDQHKYEENSIFIMAHDSWRANSLDESKKNVSMWQEESSKVTALFIVRTSYCFHGDFNIWFWKAVNFILVNHDWNSVRLRCFYLESILSCPLLLRAILWKYVASHRDEKQTIKTEGTKNQQQNPAHSHPVPIYIAHHIGKVSFCAPCVN